MENNTNYYHVIEGSHYWVNFEMLLEFLKHQGETISTDYLKVGIQNAIDRGYNITKKEPKDTNY